MKMDTLFWKNQFNELQFVFTTKQFYRQYLFKLELYAPGCKSIRDENIGESIHRRLSYARDYNYGGSWVSNKLKVWLSEADESFLMSVKCLLSEYPNIKFKTHEPRLQLYGENEETLKDFVNKLDSKYKKNIIYLYGPRDDESEKLLKNNCILRKRSPKFQYKIFFREKQFPKATRLNVYRYLLSLDEIVKLPKDTVNQLTRDHGWMWSSYFYTNDVKIVEFIRLIEPTIIREVCPLVKH